VIFLFILTQNKGQRKGYNVGITNFKHIGVIGAGQMGSGIAQVCAMSGIKVTIIDSKDEALDKSQTLINKLLNKAVSKEAITTEAKDQTLGLLNFSKDLNSLGSSDLTIEAIIENESIKLDLFHKLDELLSDDAILASNTSSIPITRIASATKRPHKVIGMHFMNPVPIMKLVEIIPGMATDSDTIDKIESLVKNLNKTSVRSQDYPGFIVNRILMPMINESFRALQEGVASAKDIDAGMKLGCNQPMGPLTLADFIGLDTCKAILEVMYQGLGDTRYAPCPLLCKYVEAGFLGRKTGRGVYEY